MINKAVLATVDRQSQSLLLLCSGALAAVLMAAIFWAHPNQEGIPFALFLRLYGAAFLFWLLALFVGIYAIGRPMARFGFALTNSALLRRADSMRTDFEQRRITSLDLAKELGHHPPYEAGIILECLMVNGVSPNVLKPGIEKHGDPRLIERLRQRPEDDQLGLLIILGIFLIMLLFAVAASPLEESFSRDPEKLKTQIEIVLMISGFTTVLFLGGKLVSSSKD